MVCIIVCVPTVENIFSVEVGGNETQFTLRELQPNQIYRLRITAGTGIGFGVPSEWAQHQTLANYNQSEQSMGKKYAIPPISMNQFTIVCIQTWLIDLRLLMTVSWCNTAKAARFSEIG